MNHSTDNDPNKYIPETYVPHVESHGTKAIWVTFWILLALTLIDIVFYFTINPSMTRNTIFIVLGIVKAYYIVGTFMHLKDERVNLMVGILGPVIFIIGLIMGLLQEGHMLSTYF
jgi:cytochrome c oxidase subunit 4